MWRAWRAYIIIKCASGWTVTSLERCGWLDASGSTASLDTIAIEISLRRTRRTGVGVYPCQLASLPARACAAAWPPAAESARLARFKLVDRMGGLPSDAIPAQLPGAWRTRYGRADSRPWLAYTIGTCGDGRNVAKIDRVRLVRHKLLDRVMGHQRNLLPTRRLRAWHKGCSRFSGAYGALCIDERRRVAAMVWRWPM